MHSTRAFYENDGKIREAVEMIAADKSRDRTLSRRQLHFVSNLKNTETALMATLMPTVLLRFKLTSSVSYNKI